MSADDRGGDMAERPPAMGVRQVVRFAIYLLLTPALLFISAGSLDWWAAWVYATAAILAVVVSRVIAAYKTPDLLVERARALDAQDAKSWDKVLVPIVAMFGPMVTHVVAGLDRRFGWTPEMEISVQWGALLVIIASWSVATWAMVVNRFFSSQVRIQHDRGHAVVSSGPYRFVRHPAYATSVLAQLAMPVALSTLWALVPSAVVVTLTIVRTALEDRTLRDELPGYTEYAARVRYRLLPGIW